MGDDQYGATAEDALVRVLKHLGPWVVLIALLAATLAIWTGFRSSLGAARTSKPSGAGSTAATGSAETSASTAVTGTIAVTRIAGVRMYAAPDQRTDVLATVAKGTTLQVLSRTDSWLRVKAPDGHMGWIANSIKAVEVRKK